VAQIPQTPIFPSGKICPPSLEGGGPRYSAPRFKRGERGWRMLNPSIPINREEQLPS